MRDLGIILTASVVTVIIRALPFLIFPENREVPKPVLAMSNLLPPAVIGMLVVYCLKDTQIAVRPWGLPAWIAVLLTGGSYVWKKNTLLSVILGTAAYMILTQTVFV